MNSFLDITVDLEMLQPKASSIDGSIIGIKCFGQRIKIQDSIPNWKIKSCNNGEVGLGIEGHSPKIAFLFLIKETT